ncbi:MAG: acyl-CoA carboxylase epsilon subunit, partial [Terrimesophilobacter sp.]
MTGDSAANDVATGDAAVPEALLRVISGHPTAAELAAVAAVIEGLVRESASLRLKAKDAGPGAWALSQRPSAVPIVPS